MCVEPKLPSLGQKYMEAGMQTMREREGMGEGKGAHRYISAGDIRSWGKV